MELSKYMYFSKIMLTNKKKMKRKDKEKTTSRCAVRKNKLLFYI